MAALSDAGLRRSEASSLTWGDVQRWDDGSGRITVVRSKTDVESQGAVVAITPAAMEALDAIRPAGAGGEVKVFGLSESQIARRVQGIAKAAGLSDWEFFSGHSGRVGMARRMAQNGAPTHDIERQGRWKQGGGMVGRYTRGETAGVGPPVFIIDLWHLFGEVVRRYSRVDVRLTGVGEHQEAAVQVRVDAGRLGVIVVNDDVPFGSLLTNGALTECH